MKLIRKPFKGSFYYEWQVGPWVFQMRNTRGITPRLVVWRDLYWRS